MKMPVLFVGHGSPMNIVAHNSFTESLQRVSQKVPRPKAILAISAHWETDGTRIQASAQPKTIHDFYGFPQELYETGYQSLGAPELAAQISKKFSGKINSTEEWGLDHGTWSILCHMYPQGDIPVTQLSLDRNLDFAAHLQMARDLRYLRDEGVLIFASGNVVHNLLTIKWQESAPPHKWAVEFDALVARALESRDEAFFTNPEKTGFEGLFRVAHPSLEHFLPLIYAVGASETADHLQFVFEGIQNASISMRSLLFSPEKT